MKDYRGGLLENRVGNNFINIGYDEIKISKISRTYRARREESREADTTYESW